MFKLFESPAKTPTPEKEKFPEIIEGNPKEDEKYEIIEGTPGNSEKYDVDNDRLIMEHEKTKERRSREEAEKNRVEELQKQINENTYQKVEASREALDKTRNIATDIIAKAVAENKKELTFEEIISIAQAWMLFTPKEQQEILNQELTDGVRAGIKAAIFTSKMTKEGTEE